MRINKLLIATILSLLFGTSEPLIAQSDSLNIGWSKLDWKDLKTTVDLSEAIKVISGSRSEQDIADLPFTVYVITGKEIRENGYLTLTDVLKRLPGIRVSQPGSAIHGETFLMRGLLGNAYTKILINDVPIKPYVTSGMPIGAQLPIRNAERIEVIYGPAATLYGADASAGVINIILKKTERPIYVQADLGFGSSETEDLNVMFSGKLGKGKRIVKFSVFGSFTAFNDRQTKYYEDSLYSPIPYEKNLMVDFTSYADSPNYQGSGDTTLLANLPHQSRALGIDLNYRNFNFYYHRFYRRDHSSLGLSPLAVSYANPLNRFGETIISTGLGYSLNKNKFRFKASFNTLAYKTDPTSSFTFVHPFINLLQQSFLEGEGTPEFVDSVKQILHREYYSDERYSAASSTEISFDFLFGYKFKRYFELAWGFSFQGSSGRPLRNFLRQPNNISTEEDLFSSFLVENDNFFNTSGFVETYFNTKRWNIILGAQAFRRTSNSVSSSRFLINPRLAVQYHLKEDLRLRLSAGKAFRYPSPFYSASTYFLTFENPLLVTTGSRLEPEETISGDFGLRWLPRKNINFDFALYYSNTSNFIRYGLATEEDSEVVTVGYTNNNVAEANLYGLQSSLQIKNIIPAIGFSLTFNFNYAIGREAVTSSNGFAGEDLQTVNLEGIRSLPKVISQIDLKFKPSDKITILLENTYMTQSLSQSFSTFQSGVFDDLNNKNAGFYTLDFLVSYKLNKHISSFVKFNNLFNTKYAGIDATEDIDALIFNPQSLRIFRIGVNYRID